MSGEITPEVPEDHPLRSLADVLDEYASSDSENIDESTRVLFVALGVERLFDLLTIAFPLLSDTERIRFLKIAAIRHHGLSRAASRSSGGISSPGENDASE